MKKHYLLLLLLTPCFLCAQTTLNGTTVPTLTDYVANGSENFAGLGEYEIFLDTQTGVLDKPIILIDGFDPGDGRSIPGLYSLLDYNGTMGTENLADFVRSEGFDVVILNFPIYFKLADNSLLHIDNATDVNMDLVIDEADYPGSTLIDGGADFIERNSMLLVDLINIINGSKVGNEELVIIGPSMGGLISRFALNYMEDDGQDAETRLWMSFDAPHHGANVPLGLQHLLNYLANGLDLGAAGNFNVTELQPIIDGLLKSPAARQLLTDHFEAHLQGGSNVNFDATKLLPEAHPWRSIFVTHIEALTSTGYPENTRNVAIINGSGIGNSYFAMGNSGPMVSPGFSVIDNLSIPVSVPLGSASVNIDTHFTPSAGITTTINDLNVEFCFIGCSDLLNGNGSAQAEAFSFSDGVDAAPGGLFDLSALTDGLPVDPGSITETFLNALTIDKFNFIPSVSALALEITNDEIDWYHDIDLGPGDPPGSSLAPNATTNNTPFVNWYLPDNNEGHVTLNSANVAFALTEIMAETLSNNQFDSSAFRIGKNPIENELLILSNQNFDKANLTITDLTGKVVFSNVRSLVSRNIISLNLSSGLYVLNIEANNQLFQTKLSVK